MSEWPGRLVLLGRPVGHSLSPSLQNAALRAAGIPLTYEAVDVARRDLATTLFALRRSRGAGNVTAPYKQDVAAACDRLSDTARAIGAVNTFWIAIDGALVGDNTDVAGFDVAARGLLGDVGGQTIALFGAGGAAAAVLAAMERWPRAQVRVYTRTAQRAAMLIRRFALPVEVVASPERALENATVLVNATPVGHRGDEMPVAVEQLPPSAAVLDLVYKRGETALVRAARARGHRAADGLAMLVEQAALAFERWFNRAPDRTVMWDAVRSAP